jgi:uncharacterized protein YggE
VALSVNPSASPLLNRAGPYWQELKHYDRRMASDTASSRDARPTVTVIGEAAIRTEPDEAIVWITLSATETSPGPALADVATRSEALAQMLDEFGIARQDRSTTGITVSEEFEHTNDGRRSLGHQALASMLVRLADTETIGRLIMRATDELDARIAGPRWRISMGNPVRLEAATRAAEHAKAKAAAYAAGVDARLGALIAISEPDHQGIVMTAAARRSGGPDIHVEAGEQEVVATVTVTFALEPV